MHRSSMPKRRPVRSALRPRPSLKAKPPKKRETCAELHYEAGVLVDDEGNVAQCYWTRFFPHFCDGRIVRCHLIREQFLRDEVRVYLGDHNWRHMIASEIWDRRIWVGGCSVGHRWFDNLPREDKHRGMLTPEAIAYGDEFPRVGVRIEREFGPPEDSRKRTERAA